LSIVSKNPFPRGLRARLTLAIAVLVILVVAASFGAIYRGTGQQLRNQLDRDLVTQAGAFAAALPSDADNRHNLTAVISRYVTHQPFRGCDVRVDVPSAGELQRGDRDLALAALEMRRGRHANTLPGLRMPLGSRAFLSSRMVEISAAVRDKGR
jgi:hypothetical protein